MIIRARSDIKLLPLLRMLCLPGMPLQDSLPLRKVGALQCRESRGHALPVLLQLLIPRTCWQQHALGCSM